MGAQKQPLILRSSPSLCGVGGEVRIVLRPGSHTPILPDSHSTAILVEVEVEVEREFW